MINPRPIILAVISFFLLLVIQIIVVTVTIKTVGDKIPQIDPIVQQLEKLNYNMYQLYTSGVNKHLASIACSLGGGWGHITNCSCIEEIYFK